MMKALSALAVWAWLKNGQTRVVVLPSPRAKMMIGQGNCHSEYFFSRSSTWAKSMKTAVESRCGERVVL